jgi:hypothetical protein
MKKILYFVFSLLFSFYSYGQANLPFEIELDTMNIFQLGGIQSYALGQSDGKWLIVGGRLDGLHKRQPFASFDPAGNNNNLIVIDPAMKQKWSAPLSSLPTNIQEQLSSTNMEFYQSGDILYCIGGYGYSATANDHTTYPYLTAIDVPKTIQSIINGTNFTSNFKQIQNSKMQVTGGKLKKVNDRYYLLGGQKFLGRYNPMGPNNGPGFIQEYTNSVRMFDLQLDANNSPQILNFTEWIDTPLFHRRDYNAEAQILSNGQEGIMMFSGVFRTDANLPYLNTISINKSNYKENSGFKHLLHNYHCPVIPLYSEANQSMYNIFFGGIAQYYYENGVLMKDDNVPFVKTISCVSRNKNDSFVETKLGIELNEYLGAGAEFIPIESISSYTNHVYKYDDISSNRELIGYIYGGISSTAANIFFSNGNDLSKASSMIFKVYLKKKGNTTMVVDANSKFCDVYPNPFAESITISFLGHNIQNVLVYNIYGQVVHTEEVKPLDGKCNIQLPHLHPNSIYFLKFSNSTESYKILKK